VYVVVAVTDGLAVAVLDAVAVGVAVLVSVGTAVSVGILRTSRCQCTGQLRCPGRYIPKLGYIPTHPPTSTIRRQQQIGGTVNRAHTNIARVAQVFEIQPETITNRTHRRATDIERDAIVVAARLLHEHGYTLACIGHLLGGRDHTTIGHHIHHGPRWETTVLLEDCRRPPPPWK
jgi:hypothetical protein